jgi:hypothetical protein
MIFNDFLLFNELIYQLFKILNLNLLNNCSPGKLLLFSYLALLFRTELLPLAVKLLVDAGNGGVA